MLEKNLIEKENLIQELRSGLSVTKSRLVVTEVMHENLETKLRIKENELHEKEAKLSRVGEEAEILKLDLSTLVEHRDTEISNLNAKLKHLENYLESQSQITQQGMNQQADDVSTLMPIYEQAPFPNILMVDLQTEKRPSRHFKDPQFRKISFDQEDAKSLVTSSLLQEEEEFKPEPENKRDESDHSLFPKPQFVVSKNTSNCYEEGREKRIQQSLEQTSFHVVTLQASPSKSKEQSDKMVFNIKLEAIDSDEKLLTEIDDSFQIENLNWGYPTQELDKKESPNRNYRPRIHSEGWPKTISPIQRTFTKKDDSEREYRMKLMDDDNHIESLSNYLSSGKRLKESPAASKEDTKSPESRFKLDSNKKPKQASANKHSLIVADFCSFHE